jgi:hypothetical protein
MARIFGQPGQEWGDQHVYEALSSLPDGCIVYSQPTLVHGSQVRDPDYVIVYDRWGVVVLEVKDWIDVVERDRRSAWIRRSARGEVAHEKSPVRQARAVAHVLSDMLKEDPDLRDYAGKLEFSYAFGGVLPHLPPERVAWLEKEWGRGYVLGRDDIRPDVIEDRISRIPVPFRVRMTERQVRAACAAIDPNNRLIDPSTGKFKGLVDRTQERILKEPIAVSAEPAAQTPATQASFDVELTPSAEARLRHLRDGMPDEVAALKATPHVRLLRGFAGTGKTDVLILRAHYLHAQYPNLQLLVTTFNDPLWANRLRPELQELKPRVDVMKFDSICASIYRKKHEQWVSPQDTAGLVAKMAEHHALIQELGQGFITEEFVWMKETGRTERERYVSEVREGRGGKGGRTLSQGQKGQVFDLFEIYEDKLRELPAYDWVDLHDKAWAYLASGLNPDKRYDVILVDEGQHFAPTWVRIVVKLLKPGGSLFICDDPSQSVYRFYSWKQKGVEVAGRTRWLRVPYRCTRELFEAAYALVSGNSLARSLLAEGGDEVVPDTDGTMMRHGPLPQVHRIGPWQAERELVLRKIAHLIGKKGLLPSEIAILHSKNHVLQRYRGRVPKGVRCYRAEQQTGMEYKAVFVPTVGIPWDEDEARQRLKFYMTMTRARDIAYLSYEGKWPTVLQPIRPYVEWIHH